MVRIGLSFGIFCLSPLLGFTSLQFAGAASPITYPTSPIYTTKYTTCIPIKDQVYGHRNVSYWVSADGLAVIDGDVIYGPLDQLLSRSFTGQHSDSVSPRAHSVVVGAKTWPGATIIYKFDSAATENMLSPIVNGAIADWKAVAPYLTFTKVANSDVGQNGVTLIKALDCGGCISSVGFDANMPRNMNLQQNCPSSPGTCGIAEATHEFGHLLGFFHEHQRFDREKFIHYNCANLNPNCTTMPAGGTCCNSGLPSECCRFAANFDVFSGLTFDASAPYDLQSIMQYRADSFAIPGTNTLTPVTPGVVIPLTNPTVIDGADAARVCKLYTSKCPKALSCIAAGCPSTCRPVAPCSNPQVCIERALPSPRCCAPVDSATCRHARDLCSKSGCDFLISESG